MDYKEIMKQCQMLYDAANITENNKCNFKWHLGSNIVKTLQEQYKLLRKQFFLENEKKQKTTLFGLNFSEDVYNVDVIELYTVESWKNITEELKKRKR